MGAELRDHRRPPPGLARVQADVQRTVDAGEVRLSESSPSATRFRRAGRGRVEVITFKPLSKNPGALQSVDPDGYRDYATSIHADPDRPPISSITFHFDASTTDDILVKLNRVSFRVVHSY